jgi:hypothetical protein
MPVTAEISSEFKRYLRLYKHTMSNVHHEDIDRVETLSKIWADHMDDVESYKISMEVSLL